MRLKRLELFGFKSFADRMILDFSAPVIGIVGPNGCGKSNVVDAVRWVLGEQRPTSMRGGEMTDVIFKGSASRPALAVAEATIVFDNAGGTFEGRGSEVSVTRRVYKSGEGEYSIDGHTVRLRDVREMLYGTGLGSRGYSVLEQGKIDAVLSANPIERRAIFEEAAGISRYRARKKETEARLERVQADCVRLDDVVQELERRRRSLKIQAGKAQRYVEARDAWRTQGTLLARCQLAALERELAALGGELGRSEREAEDLRERRTRAEADIDEREREQESLLAEIERLAGASAEAAAELRGLEERRTQLLERAANARSTGAGEAGRIEELERRCAERAAESRALEQTIAEFEVKAQEAQERARVLAVEVAALERDLTRAQEIQRAGADEVLALLHARTTAENHLHAIERAELPLDERIARAEGRRAELQAQIDLVRSEREEKLRVEETLRQRVAALERERAEREEEALGLEARRADLEARRGQLEVEIARLQSRVDALRDREQERAGLEAGARELFRAQDAGEGPELSGELAGLLADHLHPDSRTSRAFDAILGSRAQAIVAASPADAGGIVAWLKQRTSGRVSLVLPAGLAPGLPATGPRELPEELRSVPGVLGRLVDASRPEPGYEELAELLLGDAVLVEDLPRAMALAARHPRLRFVTREGDLADAAGISGGFFEVSHGPVGRRSFAAELEQGRRVAEEELAGLERELAVLGSDQNEHSARLRVLAGELESAAEARALARSACDSLLARAEELENARLLAAHECAEQAGERERLQVERAEVSARLAESTARLEAERVRLDECEQECRALEGERDQRARDDAGARVEATELVERLEAHRRDLLQRRRAEGDLAAELERARRLDAEQTRLAQECEQSAAELIERHDGLLETRGSLEEELIVVRAREREGRKAVEDLRAELHRLTSELERALGALGEQRLARQRHELAQADVVRRAQEDFALGVDDLRGERGATAELIEPDRLEALAEEVRALKESLEQLGPINVEAVTELAEVEERHSFLSGQKDDLDEARRSLEGTLKRLNEESQRLFLESFEVIRGHFRAIFRQLFGGGRADVALLDPTAVLESGIEITARPPGREALPISLLSGGQRTLTALAILFAVFRTHPSPFCILDEVDAALDDANIGRFLGLLQETLGDTQCIVVTHNKGTMSACNLLYGVTMAVRGVSHVVSVELSEVDAFVPPSSRTNGDASAERAERVEPEPLEADGLELEIKELTPMRRAADPVRELPVEALPSGEPAET